MASLKKRGNKYYLQYYIGGVQHRKSLDTSSLQIAKERKRQFESAMLRQDDIPLPTKTPLPAIVEQYINHIKTYKTRNSIKVDLFYLREAFGPICDALSAPRALRKPEPNHIVAAHLEDITTAQVSQFLSTQVQTRHLAPKTANRYREVLHGLFAWAMDQRGIKTPGNRNPVAMVTRYKEKAPEIRFLTLEEIDQQLEALAGNPQIQTMVAVYIYAGLRREEALWLTHADVDLKTAPFGMFRVCAKTVNGEHWEPKTKRNRVVPINSDLRPYLDRYQPRIVPGHWFFPSPEGMRWNSDNFSRTLRDLNIKTNLAWSCAEYRHTFGSQLAMKGESLYKVATVMGNSPEICRRHYAALSTDSLLSAVDFPTSSTHGVTSHDLSSLLG